jgi:hypothetical protein
MRTVWVMALLLTSLLSPVQAETALTPKEITEGWLLLFDGETTFGWKARGNANWTVKDGMIEASGEGDGMLATTTEFADYEVKAECWIDKDTNSGVFLRAPMGDVEITPMNSYEVNINDAHPQWPSGSINGVAKTRSRVTTVGKWSRVDVRAEGERVVVKFNGKTTLDTKDTKLARGVFALQHFGKGTVRFRNIKLRPLGLKSLFNGKDLTGWTVFPGRASVYSVTPEGWLNVKNGNGDIQSTAQFGDFTLQLEIISNGQYLNSGVFFRANPDKFWEGYESQIRNQWQGDDRTKPVDFGTGGLYNRQPARKVVSNDREWFTMTTIAHGNHFASWVNGYQVTDFTDTRPADEGNARRGLRTKPGVISLQGHDPMTDLSFRNIRAVEYPKPQ